MVGDAEAQLVRPVRPIEPAKRAECTVKTKLRIRVFIFGKQCHIGHDECAEAGKNIEPYRDLCLCLRLHRTAQASNEDTRADADIGLICYARIAQENIRPD